MSTGRFQSNPILMQRPIRNKQRCAYMANIRKEDSTPGRSPSPILPTLTIPPDSDLAADVSGQLVKLRMLRQENHD